MSDPILAFIDFMRSVDCGPADSGEIIADDKPRRYRLAGDKPKVRNASYQLAVEGDGFAAGWVRSFKQGETHPWHSKSARKASDADRAEWKRKTEAAKAAREISEAEAAARAAQKAAAIWAAAEVSAVAPYLTRKGCLLHGARVWQGKVVVPLYIAKKLSSVQLISGDGSKRFLTGGEKAGAYFPMATKDEAKSVILIGEGFATMAALRVSLGFPCIVAFDAGNLKPVAQAIRSSYPDAEIIFAADNDQWTARQDGSAWNPGMDGAKQAAVAIGGARVIAPDFPADDPEKRTDWDDVWRALGADAIVEAFNTAMLPDSPADDYHLERDYGPPADAIDSEVPFKCLGFDEGTYYFLPSCNGGQIVAMRASALAQMSGLLTIHSSYDYWKAQFGGDGVNDRKAATLAASALMDHCHREGIFRLAFLRGAGAWRDGDTTAINDGRTLHVRGRRVPIYAWSGEHTYTADAHCYRLDGEALGNAEAVKLRDICAGLQWANPLLGDLFAGWLTVAPFAAALRWRSHGQLTGPSGSGKTWVLDNILKPALGPTGIMLAKPTEALVRSRIGRSGRPVVIDEAEAEDQHGRDNLQKIMYFMRAASTGAETGTSIATVTAMSAFMLISINGSAVRTADENRITQFVLTEARDDDKAERFSAMEAKVRSTLTKDYFDRLRSRTARNLDALYDNELTFRTAASALFPKQRNADQLAPMIAGLYMLTSTARITLEAATAWLRARDWSWHQSAEEESDSHKFLRHLLTSRRRYDTHGIARETTVGQMIEIAADHSDARLNDVNAALKSLGIKVHDGWIIVANNSPGIREIMDRTPWGTWATTLAAHDGADDNGNKPVHFAPGLVSKAKRIPLASVIAPLVQQDSAGGTDIDWF